MNIDTNKTIKVVLGRDLHKFFHILWLPESLLSDWFVVEFMIFHHLLERVGLKIQYIWELKARINFVILERIHIENESLELNQEHVGCFGNQLPLHELSLSITFVAGEIIDNFSLDQALEAFVESLCSDDGQCERVVDFNLVSDGATLLANQLGARIMAEDVVDKTPLTGRLKLLLEAVKEKPEELVGVLLLADGSWCTRVILEGEADLFGAVSMAVRHLQESE